MAIVSKGSGGSIKFTGTGGGISISSSGGGGGGGSPINPSSRGDLKLRFVAGDYSSYYDNHWNPSVSGSSTMVEVYYASGWSMKSTVHNDGNVPSFNGQGSMYISDFAANNYNGMWGSPSLDAPGGSTARSLYMVAYIPDINQGTDPTRMFGYGNESQVYDKVGFTLQNGYIYGSATRYAANGGADGSTTKGAPVSSGTPFVVSFTYAAGSNLKDNPIYVNGVAGTYGAGSGGAINSNDDGSGIVGNQGWGIAFDWKLGYGQDPGGSGANFYVADVLVFNTAHDSSTRAGVESWLMTQYGL